MQDYRQLDDVAPWVNWLVKFKLKFLVIPIGYTMIVPFAIWYGTKSFYTEAKLTVVFCLEDAKELKEWLKGQ